MAAERALAERKLDALSGPFGGSAPAWARDWVTRRGRNDIFDRRWHARVVRLPAPYRGTEWLAVFSMYHPVESDADHFHRLKERNGAWVVGAEIEERQPAEEYRITHHQAEVQLLPDDHRLRALDRMTVRRLPSARGLMLARMNEEFAVEAVRVAGAAVPFARDGGLLAISMPSHVPAETVVEVSYSGQVQHPGMDNIDTDSAILFSYWYPNIARLPATGDLASSRTAKRPASWRAPGGTRLTRSAGCRSPPGRII
jgi:hypothetical protein